MNFLLFTLDDSLLHILDKGQRVAIAICEVLAAMAKEVVHCRIAILSPFYFLDVHIKHIGMCLNSSPSAYK